MSHKILGVSACWLAMVLISISCGKPATFPVSPSEPKTFSMTSTAFQPNDYLPAKYTCDSQDISPALAWTQPPNGTKSLALICDDPDAPGGIWAHWVIFNIPETARQLPEAVPAQSQLTDGSLQGVNDFGRIGYSGPCPLSGKPHHYQFTLYALDQVLSITAGASKNQLVAAMQGHILSQTQLVGLYQK